MMVWIWLEQKRRQLSMTPRFLVSSVGGSGSFFISSG